MHHTTVVGLGRDVEELGEELVDVHQLDAGLHRPVRPEV